MRLKASIRARAILALAIAACSGNAASQAYPAKPVKLIVGFSAGGGTDVTARMVAHKLSEAIGQQVIVDNKPGSGGMIATTAAAQAPADGYTLLMAAAADAVQPAIRPSLPYDLEKDFAPVSLVVTVPFAFVVHPSVPARNVRELIALAKSRPGVLNYGSSGIGSSAHLSNELFNSMAHVKITHVPYKGVSQGIAALAGGQIDMIFASFPASLPLLEAKKIRILAVSTAKRASVMPELPTVSESGLPGYERYGWYGVLTQAKVSRQIVSLLNAEIVKSVNTPELKKLFINQGLEPVTNSPQEFSRFIASEIRQTAKLIRASGTSAF